MTFSLPLQAQRSGEVFWKTVHAAAVSALAPIGDYEKTAERYAHAISSLDDTVKLVVTPEVALGYQRERAYHQPESFVREFRLMMEHIAPLSARGRLILWGLPLFVSGCPYNAVAYLYDGNCLGFGAKTKLAQGGEYEDSRYFTPLEPGFVSEVRIGADETAYPFGDIVVDIGGVRIKGLVCEDLWFEGGPAAKVAEEGVDIIAWLNTSHEQVGKQFDRLKIIDTTSLRTSTAIVSANALGVQGGHHVFGGGNMISVAGRLIAAEPRFNYSPWVCTQATIDVEQLRNLKLSNHSHRSHTPRAEIVFRAGALFSGLLPSDPIDEQKYVASLDDDLDAISIIGYWCWQQFVSSHQQGMLVLNSGGSDSRTHLLLAVYGLHCAIQQLGVEGFRRALAHIEGIDEVTTLADFTSRYVYGPYLRGQTSGTKTQSAAEKLCNVLSLRWALADIQEIEQALNRQTAQLLAMDAEALTWDNPAVASSRRLDRTLQNSPARVRGTLGWQMANGKSLFYFGTSNLDEVWSKYFTLSGDDSAAASGLAGCGKLRIKRCQERCAKLLGVWTQLEEEITDSVATAELRPAAQEQTDDADCGLFEHRTMCRELIIGQDKNALQAFLAIAYHFADKQKGVSEQHALLEDIAFAVVRFVQPALGMHWARMQLALSPVVEAGSQHAATEESNRRAAVDLRYRYWIRDLVEYLKENIPEVLPGLAARSGIVDEVQ